MRQRPLRVYLLRQLLWDRCWCVTRWSVTRLQGCHRPERWHLSGVVVGTQAQVRQGERAGVEDYRQRGSGQRQVLSRAWRPPVTDELAGHHDRIDRH